MTLTCFCPPRLLPGSSKLTQEYVIEGVQYSRFTYVICVVYINIKFKIKYRMYGQECVYSVLNEVFFKLLPNPKQTSRGPVICVVNIQSWTCGMYLNHFCVSKDV